MSLTDVVAPVLLALVACGPANLGALPLAGASAECRADVALLRERVAACGLSFRDPTGFEHFAANCDEAMSEDPSACTRAVLSAPCDALDAALAVCSASFFTLPR